VLKDAFARFSRHTVIYAIAGQSSRIVSFVMIRFFTKHIDLGGYGVNEMLSVMLSVLAYLAGINMADTMARYYFDSADAKYRRTVVSTAVLAVAGASLLLGALLALGAAPIGRLLGGDSPDMTRLVLITLGILVLQTLREMFFSYLRIEERSTAFGVVSLCKSAIEIGLQIWLVGYRDMGVLGMFWAVLAGEFLAVLFMSLWVLPAVGLGFSRPLFRSMALFVAPLIPTGILQFCLHSGDRFILKWMTNEEQVGIYALAYKLGLVPNLLLLSPFLLVWYPYVFSLADDEKRRHFMARFTPYFMFAMTVACLGVALLAREVVTLMAGKVEYRPAWIAIGPVCAGYWFWGCFQIVQTGFHIRRQTRHMPALTAVAVAVNILLNVALIPSLGFVACAWVTMVTFAVLFAITVRAVRPVFPVPWPWRRVFVPALSAAALCVAGSVADLAPGMTSIGIKLTGFLLWLTWMWAGGFLGPDERNALTGVLRGFIRKD